MFSALANLCIATFLLNTLAQATDFSFDRGTIPTRFSVRESYPDRDEDTECRPIRVRIARDSFRFTRDLRVNYNRRLTFRSSDARRMTSRCQSRLDALASTYYKRYRRNLEVLLGWVDYDSDVSSLGISNTSLHYEGRSVRIRGHTQTIAHYSEILIMAIESGFDWVYLESESYIRLSVVPDLCRINMDLIWILDQSGSVGRSNHRLALQFIGNVHNFFEIGLERTRVGMVTYSTQSRIPFDLDDLTTRTSLQRAVSRISYPGGYTRTAQALRYTRALFDESVGRGVRPSSKGIPRVAVLITDGKSNLEPLDDEPQLLKDSGVVVYSVGIGNIDLDELLEISSDPDQLYVYLLRRYTDAASFVDLIGATLCESPAIVITGSFIFTRVSRAEFRYFQSTCGRFTRNTTVIIEVRDTIGFSFVYVSTTINNPGPVSPRPYVVASTNAAFKRKRRLITIQFNAELTFSRTVYISVEGTEDTNEFEMTVYEMLFDPSILEVTVPGDSTPSHPIINVRDYLTSQDSFVFSITEGNTGDRFSIDQSTGAISAQTLDPDDALVYNLTVIAENVQDPCQRSRVYVVVMVTPGNNYDPVFNTLAPISIPETTSNGDDIVVVTATDDDPGTSGEIVYSIINGNENGVFDIDPISGTISVLQSQFLNQSDPAIPRFQLTIQAADGGSPQRNATAVQVIDVTDVNEAPYFTTPCALNNTCAFSISEGAGMGESIGVVMATDVDPGTNGMLTYLITTTSVNLFHVTNNGTIVVNGNLDYDTGETSFLIEVVVRDGGNPSLSTTTEVSIDITDINDTPPTINARSPVDLLESATGLVATVVSDDPDTVGGPTTFTLTGSPLFEIDCHSGEITLTGPLDYETQTRHSVTVMAEDDGGLSSSADIIFNVIDENDNSPIFFGEPYIFSLVEEQVMEDFGGVFANDSDSGINAQIKYSLRPTSNLFNINEQSGRLSSDKLDREDVDFHSLTVVATDCGNPSRSSTSTIRITVTDINDNRPTFRQQIHRLELREDVGVPRNVLIVMATDRDAPGTDNSRIAYTVLPNEGFFEVDTNSGQLQLVQELDYETNQRHNITVVATDQGQPALNGSTVVIVTVIDVNDNVPTITSNLSVNISELTQPGTPIAQFMAEDQDGNSVLRYSIVEDNGEGLFTVNSSTGLVTLLSMLDYEIQQSHELNISVSDQGGGESFGALRVNVINENDNTPVISVVTSFNVSEEEPVSTSLFTANVSDADLDPFGTVTLLIFSQPISGVLDIDNNGLVTIADVIDRESLPPNSNDQFIVTIEASDGQKSSTATVIINVLDINDNDPIFVDHSTSMDFQEEQMTGTTLTMLSANDADIQLNGDIRYSITNQTSLPFTIDSVSGAITSTRKLDRESGDDWFMLEVVASDRGTPSRNATTVISVRVVDINDNPPTFNNALHQISISENTTLGALVVQLQAQDPDQGSNGQFAFQILSGNEDSTFHITNDTGLLTVSRNLDFEQRQMYRVTIAAVDMGTPSLQGSAVVEVNVVNIDESPPQFVSPCYRELEETPVAQGDPLLVLVCRAEDYDDGRVTGFKVNYELVSVNGRTTELNHPFSSIIRNGQLLATRDLDFEAESNWTLFISATDPSGNKAYTYAYVIILDVNDNAPMFTNPPFEAVYAAVENTLIFKLEAEDLDTGLNGLFEIYLANPPFTKREDSEIYDVMVNATDFGTPRLTGSVTLQVTLRVVPCSLVDFFLDYTPNDTHAFVYIRTLCAVEVEPIQADLVLGQNHTFQCFAKGNTNITYQWIHNGSAITEVSNSGELVLTDIAFENAGHYACVAISTLGSIQTETVNAIVLVAPIILTPPSDVTVELGRMVSFWCISVGSPEPQNRFMHTRRFTTSDVDSDGRIIVTPNLLFIPSVVAEDDGYYQCVASNSAGEVTSDPARLFIFGLSNLISVTVEEIQSPDAVGQCQAFNPTTFANSANQASNNQLEMHIINSTGENVCSPSACSPNPCLNEGMCSESNTTADGYTCTCLDGWSGTICESDIDECATDPCLFGGNCTNTNGSFQCACAHGYFGPTCKYRDVCNHTLCPEGQVCIETIVVVEGYDCVDNNTQMIVVTGLPGVTSGDLDGTIELNNLEDPVPFASPDKSGKRRKRQSSDQLLCEVRTHPVDGQKFQLVFVCPDGATPPDTSDFMEVCQLLLANGQVGDCSFPDGNMVTRPEPVQLPPARITISFIVTDPRSNLALIAEDGLEELERFNVLEALKDQGYQVQNPVVGSVVTPPTARPTEPVPDYQVATVVGAVVGVLGAVFIILAIVGVFICCFASRSSGKLIMSTATAKRRMSMIARPKSTVVNTTVDLGTQGTYTVNQYGPELQNPTFVNEWTNGNGNENGFEDSEIGVESLKSRIDEVMPTSSHPELSNPNKTTNPEKSAGIRKVPIDKKGKKLETTIVNTPTVTPNHKSSSTSTTELTTNWE